MATICCARTCWARMPEVLWELYILLTQIEAAFKTLKSELGLRPDLSPGGETAWRPTSSWPSSPTPCRSRSSSGCTPCAPGLTPRAVLEKLATIQMLDVCLPTTDGRWLIMPRYTQPEPEQSAPAPPTPPVLAVATAASHQGPEEPPPTVQRTENVV